MDDMDDALFGSSMKSRPGSTTAKEKLPKQSPTKTKEKDKHTPERTLELDKSLEDELCKLPFNYLQVYTESLLFVSFFPPKSKGFNEFLIKEKPECKDIYLLSGLRMYIVLGDHKAELQHLRFKNTKTKIRELQSKETTHLFNCKHSLKKS